MSRIGKMPIAVPAGVEVTIADGNYVTVKGPKGTLEQQLPGLMTITQEGAELHVTRPNDEHETRAMHGLTRSLLHNMVVGVEKGFSKELEVNGVGYRVQKDGKKLVMNLGYSHQVIVEEPEGITLEVPTPNKIVVSGTDKQKVGQIAAEIRGKRPPEPYKGKGIKYTTETIRRKEGKAGGKKYWEVCLMVSKIDKKAQRQKRHVRVRSKISGTPERPRLCVFRSNANIYAQVIDDVNGVTLASASTLDKEFEGAAGNCEAAKKVGAMVAQRAKEKGISVVVFDRGGCIYHGRVAALAEGAREGGLEF